MIDFQPRATAYFKRRTLRPIKYMSGYRKRLAMFVGRDFSELQKRSVVSFFKRPVISVKPRGEATYIIHPLMLPANISVSKKPDPYFRRKKLALLLPGHNEELIIATTIRSAVAAGQKIEDIYVVDDCSDDKTRKKALALLPKENVLTVERSGKALAVDKAIKKFNIVERYKWVHVADADSVFCPDYFRIYRRKLNDKRYVVAVGFVQSMRGNWISTYRALSYSYGQHLVRRLQSMVGMITVFPGPTTSFRTDILKDLNFNNGSMTEDFDLTLQVHRKKLGKIMYIPDAISYTQDPQTLADFSKQTSRWFRGYFQGIMKYRIGTRLQAIDIGIGYQLLESIVYFLQLFVFVPIVIATTGNWLIIPVILASDFVVMSIIAMFSGILAKRWAIVGSLPYFYFLRWVELSIFLKSFVEVVILKKFKTEVKGWATEGRRYKLNYQALQDVAK